MSAQVHSPSTFSGAANASLDSDWAKLIEPEWIENLDRVPFLTRCRSGEVTRPELNTFLIQHCYYARHFTRFLCAVMSNMSDEHDRLELMENLVEEAGFAEDSEIPHAQLYREMMRSMGVDPTTEPIFESTQQLIDAMYDCCRNSNPLVGLAALCLGAEAIVPHLYSQVIGGFLSQGEPLENLNFFTIHVQCDDGHAITMRNILERSLASDSFQTVLLKLTAARMIQARTRFFEGISGRSTTSAGAERRNGS